MSTTRMRSRRDILGERLRYLRRHWVNFGALAAAAATAAGVLSMLYPAAQRGFVLGLLFASIGWTIAWWTALYSGTMHRGAGFDAEDWTSRELRALRKRGFIEVRGLRFWDGNVDHVLVGHAGVFAIETKWTSCDGSVPAEVLQAWLERSRARARHVRLLLAPYGGWQVQAAIALWGPNVRQRVAPDSARPVFLRSDITHLPDLLPVDILTRKQIKGTAEALIRHRDKQPKG